MPKRMLGMMTVVCTALVSVLVGASPAAAAAGWSVTPEGPAEGHAGVTTLSVRPAAGGDDVVMDCVSSDASVNAASTAESKVADITAVSFNDCLLAGLISFEVEAITPWEIHALGYTDPVVAGEIRGISARIFGPGCEATVGGTVNGSYNNATSELASAGDFTLQVLTVDPNGVGDDCLGLIAPGDAAAFQGVYAVSPALQILPA